MKKYVIIFLMILASCQQDDAVVNNNSVSFSQQTLALDNSAASVNIVFLKPTATDGTLTITVTPTNVEYGTDFVIDPAAAEDQIVIPFAANTTTIPVNFTALTGAIEGQQKNVVLKITSITLGATAIPQATSSVQINFDQAPVAFNTIDVATGGPTVPNQVYIDLSSGIQTSVLRTFWDLGFYSGTDFRVALNGSVNMAVKQLATTDMTEVVAIDETVAVGVDTGSGISNGDIAYTDSPSGNISQTAIVVAENDADNKVYLLNLGFAIPGEVPAVGQIDAYGEHRGWMKVRFLRDGDSYKMQYADAGALSFAEVIIAKTPNYNFTFFSFETDAIVDVEPETTQWDLNFTTFTDHVNAGGMFSLGVQDFVVTNVKGGTRAYQVLTSAIAYDDFTFANVNASHFDTATAMDQRAIGADWRTTTSTTAALNDDRYYILRDAANNIYKLRFTALTNDDGVRGNTTFEYMLLQ